VRELCQQWRWDYNHERPHKSLGYLSPVLYANKHVLISDKKEQTQNEALSIDPRRHGSLKAAAAV